ncbi:hypothetical protein E2C01_029757 [Portunus trituberculatus]|uniref:Uncharacterized protein n=1 Tax=Portunus trituberculatus TaxID=210409 RepID=A0A5B7ETS2_PORTR|nr:hypothetical protein [Portunus trituberculatus]
MVPETTTPIASTITATASLYVPTYTFPRLERSEGKQYNFKTAWTSNKTPPPRHPAIHHPATPQRLD